MITKEGYFRCDICGDETGLFDDLTGNHPQCNELAAMRRRVAELSEKLDYYECESSAEIKGCDRHNITWYTNTASECPACELERRVAELEAALKEYANRENWLMSVFVYGNRPGWILAENALKAGSHE